MRNLTEELQRLREEAEMCSKEHIIDTLVAIYEDREQLSDMLSHGLYVPMTVSDRVDGVFTDHISANRIINSVYLNALRTLEMIAVVRESVAISGAMRWHWSQEAPITTSYSVRI